MIDETLFGLGWLTKLFFSNEPKTIPLEQPIAEMTVEEVRYSLEEAQNAIQEAQAEMHAANKKAMDSAYEAIEQADSAEEDALKLLN